MTTRTIEQEAAIDAAILHLEKLLSERRASRGVTRPTRYAVQSAVVGAALCIVAEPEGQGAIDHQLKNAMMPGFARLSAVRS